MTKVFILKSWLATTAELKDKVWARALNYGWRIMDCSKRNSACCSESSTTT